MLDYFKITYDEQFRGLYPEEKDAREEILRLTKIIDEQNELIETFKRVMKVIRNLSEETFQKFTNKDLVELMWKSMNEKLEYSTQSKKEISN
ncbi:hypothetical protein ACFLSV_03905 [Bacteroidota bacterium]